MQVTHAGYKDPNNIKFENITILGVPYPPSSVSVTQVGTGSPGTPTTLPNSNIQYDADKKVNTHFYKNSFINYFLSTSLALALHSYNPVCNYFRFVGKTLL